MKAGALGRVTPRSGGRVLAAGLRIAAVCADEVNDRQPQSDKWWQVTQ